MLCLHCMKRLSAILIVILAAILPGRAQSNDVLIPIAKYMAMGDAESLSAWFAPSLEIVMPNTFPSDCSTAQAKQIMKAFFKSYTPTDFTITHQAGQGNLKYALGQMKTSEEAFIVTIFVSYTSEKGYKIQQLKIERAD